MKFFSILAATVISGALAAPASDAVPRADVQTAHFVFQGAESGSYNMSVKADGKVIETCMYLPFASHPPVLGLTEYRRQRATHQGH